MLYNSVKNIHFFVFNEICLDNTEYLSINHYPTEDLKPIHKKLLRLQLPLKHKSRQQINNTMSV